MLKNPTNSWYPEPTRSRGREEVVPLDVGRTAANPWGLHDVHGNVEEWVADWYGPYEAGDTVDPVGRTDGDFKVTRGGSHGTVAFYLRSANRMGTLPEDRTHAIGFRVVLGRGARHRAASHRARGATRPRRRPAGSRRPGHRARSRRAVLRGPAALT